jgi:hypothetical protein
MYDDLDGPLLDELIDNHISQDGDHRDELHFMQQLDLCLDNNLEIHDEQQTTKYEPVGTPVPKSFLIGERGNPDIVCRLVYSMTRCWICPISSRLF